MDDICPRLPWYIVTVLDGSRKGLRPRRKTRHSVRMYIRAELPENLEREPSRSLQSGGCFMWADEWPKTGGVKWDRDL